MGVNVSITCDFTDKTVLITGATRGLGKHLAEAFAKAGANLVLLARQATALDQSVRALKNQYASQSFHAYPIDLSDQQAVSTLLSSLDHEVDVLINNAAIQGPVGHGWENSASAVSACMQVNLLSPMALCQWVIPTMLARQTGNIINLAGGGATAPRQYFSTYAVAKTGLVRYSECVAAELANTPLRINCISPGVMATDMVRTMLTHDAQWLHASEKSKMQTALSRSNSFAAATECCLFLASAQCGNVSGKLISAEWDDWQALPKWQGVLNASDIYTLRRIVPKDRETLQVVP
jgi:short-subunit dehydrogenase